MRRTLFALVCAGALLLGTRAINATVLLPAAFRDVVAGSAIIAHVQVADVRAEWADGRRRIDSFVTAVVIASFKGDVGETLSFKVPGGELGRYRSVTVGAPVFKPGDEAVLCLSATEGEPLHVFGLNQGVFRVRQDPVSGRRMVITPIVAARGEEPVRVIRGSIERRPIAMEEFGRQVRGLIAQLQQVQP
jgi:hypothetical protein